MSSGLDDISPTVLKLCAPKLAYIFTGLFHSSYNEGIFSNTSTPCPLEEIQYHSLLTSLCLDISKTMESINSNVIKQLENNEIRHERQTDFAMKCPLHVRIELEISSPVTSRICRGTERNLML